MKPVRLSKSKIMSALQCRKRIWLEIHQPELAEISPATQAAFDIGHQVGDIAMQVYGQGQGVFIDYAQGLGRALKQSQALLAGFALTPVFEATFKHQDVLVREDVLLPADGSWRMVEVKASTSLKPEHLHDCAIQAWVHQGAGYPLASVALAHINNQFVYQGDKDYAGLFTEQDLTDQVQELQSSVPLWVEQARDAASGAMPEVAVGQQCSQPYACPFFNHCWPTGSRYPVHGLGGSKKRLGELVQAGYRDILDVPDTELSNTQRRIQLVTRAGEPELLSDAAIFVHQLPYPRFYLDFETIGPPVPIWPNTRPYETLPFQWSCHIEAGPGNMHHCEFLDLSGDAPMRPLALALIKHLVKDGPILMYTNYEQKVIEGLAARFPDLASDLQALVDRLVDLHPVVKENYYHPDMLGSWSIKAVLPTMAPEMDYGQLEGIQQGTEASNAYLEAINPATPAEQVEKLRNNLLSYCRFDTEAMVRIVHYFARG